MTNNKEIAQQRLEALLKALEELPCYEYYGGEQGGLVQQDDGPYILSKDLNKAIEKTIFQKKKPQDKVSVPIGYYTPTVTIEDIRKAKPKKIYYSTISFWWTHNPDHLRKHPTSGLPCDPRGGMILTDNPRCFLRAAETSPDHFGKHGLKAFMAAHHENMALRKDDPWPGCFSTWEEYNDAIDRREAEDKK